MKTAFLIYNLIIRYLFYSIRYLFYLIRYLFSLPQ